MIRVRSGLTDKSRVALWERHPDHPGGEVYIADGKTYHVAETQQVREALGQGRLVVVESEPAAPPARKK